MVGRVSRGFLVGAGLWQLALCASATGFTQTTGNGVVEVLDERSFVQALTERNLELQFGRQSVDVAAELARGETGVYEPVLFGSVRNGDTERLRSTLEREGLLLGGLNGAKASDTQIFLNQESRQMELGVRGRTAVGGEVSLSARRDETKSNVLKTAGTDLEVNAALALTYKQPLMRGRGAVAVETDLRVAELEWQATQWQHRQQLQKITAEGLSSFWQIRTADEVVSARQELARIAAAMIEDARSRVAAGKLSDLAMGQLERELAVRQSDVLRAEQTRDELLLRLFSTLNLPSSQLDLVQLSGPFGEADAGPEVDLETALAQWAPYQIARLRREQGAKRLDYARNQSLPGADLVMSYSQTALSDPQGKDAWERAKGPNFPDWYIGVNVELGLWGQRRASAQMLAQEYRLSQSDTELQAIRIAFANDWFARQQAWQRAQSELTLMRTEYASREHMAQAEQQRLDAGMGSRAAAWVTQQEALESLIRLRDAQGRAESARLSLLLAKGTLLNTYGVSFEISQGL